MNSSIDLKVGGIELSVHVEDGDAASLLEKVIGMLDDVIEKQSKVPQVESKPDVLERSKQAQNNVQREGTINTVIAKLGGGTCREIMIAAAAHLILYEGKEKFLRAEWVSRAKEANSWKVDYSNQMSTAVKRLVDAGIIVENSKDVFSLSMARRAEIEAKLAD